MHNLNVLIRPGAAGDVAFVSSTWKQSFWRESPWANRLRWPVFNAGHSPVVARLLERSVVLVACDPEHPDEIVGYLVFDLADRLHDAVHFAYVKPAFRRAGVFRALLEASPLPQDLAGVVVTHPTRAWFSAPPLTAKSGETLKPGRPGLEEKFRATYDPYRWMSL